MRQEAPTQVPIRIERVKTIELILRDITDFVRLPSPIRAGFVGYLTDHLMLVCREEFPSGPEVESLIVRGIMYERLGVVRDLIEQGELAVLATQVSHLQDRQESEGIRSRPGELWTNVMVATEMNVAGFGDLNSASMKAAQDHLRVFLTMIDRTLGRNGLVVNGKQLPDRGDSKRYQQRFKKAINTGVASQQLKHAELIGASVLVKHHMPRAGGGMNG